MAVPRHRRACTALAVAAAGVRADRISWIPEALRERRLGKANREPIEARTSAVRDRLITAGW